MNKLNVHVAMLGNLRKMRVSIGQPIIYHLMLGEEQILLNDYLGKKIKLKFTGQINCIHCGRKITKSFQQGYCFPCLRRLQECNLCVIYPEKCRVEEGNCDPNDWAHVQCSAEHVVYLANSSGLKVGITRVKHVPSRWIDQGASQALVIYKTSNRYQVGLIEVAFKEFVSDRTNWRSMLKQVPPLIDLKVARDKLVKQAARNIDEVARHFPNGVLSPVEEEVVVLEYPVLQYPEKVMSLSFDKTNTISGTLLGIKGQYVILDNGVLNIRKFGGYQVHFMEV